MPREEITGILKAHSEKVVTPTTSTIYMCQADVWTTAFRQFNRPRFFECSGMLYVIFASDETDMEEDADAKLFCLLMRAIF